MEGIREIARSYFEKANEEEQISIVEFFTKLDADGDGRISLTEFKKSVSSWLRAETLFEKLDKNGDGSLDFEEYLCLHYMEKKVDIPKCSHCGELLVGPYFSCLLCIGKGANAYGICCSCYRHPDFSHEHSSEYMMDHHSLLMEFRNRTAAAAETSHKKKEMEELREIAKAHRQAGSKEVQELAYEFYKSMDSDGDGRVDLSEFLALMMQEGYSCMQNTYFFEELDLDSNGTLDFSEVMTLYYIIKSGRPFCSCCAMFIPGIFFSCVDCFKNSQTPFHMCRGCYLSPDYNHNHDGRRAQFLDNYTLLQAMRDPVTPGANLTEVWNKPSNAHEICIHNHSSPTYNTYVTDPQSAIAIPESSNTNWSKWKVALSAFEAALSIGSVSSTLCTIL